MNTWKDPKQGKEGWAKEDVTWFRIFCVVYWIILGSLLLYLAVGGLLWGLLGICEGPARNILSSFNAG